MPPIINHNYAIALKERLRGSQLERKLATAGFMVQTKGAQNPVITATVAGQTIYFREADTQNWVDSVTRTGRYGAIGVSIGFDHAARILYEDWLGLNPEDYPEHLPEEKDPRDRPFSGSPFSEPAPRRSR